MDLPFLPLFYLIFLLSMQGLTKLSVTVSPSSTFKVATTWNAIRSHHLIWYAISIPTHCFILSMAIRWCLRTKDTVGAFIHSHCSLCNLHNEYLHHLFFHCPFSRIIGSKYALAVAYLKLSKLWDEEILWLIEELCGKSCHTIIRNIALATMIYYIWHERNGGVFQENPRSSSVLLKDRSDVKLKGCQFSNVKPNFP